jgi:putative Mg2+ transporter-C (MgtC) family protein
VALGAAAFVDIGMHLNGNAGATQIIAYVVSGVGFIGAGVIMKQGGNVWGLNTAATLWCSAAVGACAGADLAIEASKAGSIPLNDIATLRRRWYRVLQRNVPFERPPLCCLTGAEGHPPERAARRARPAAMSRVCKAQRPRP